MASRARKKWEKPKPKGAAEAGTVDKRAAAETGLVEKHAAAEAACPPAPEREPGFWRRHWRWLAALWVCSLLPYLNSFRDGFPFDNSLAIQVDTRIRAATWANLHTIWTTDYWYKISSSGLYRPLTTLSYLFNYAVLGNGMNPAGYHVFNSILQAVNVSLVYWLGLEIFEAMAPAFALAALWAVHPLLTESVTNIVGRADELAALAVLAGLLFHIRAGAAVGRRRFAWLAALAAVVWVGMFSKESAVVVLAVMQLYDVAFPGAGTWRRRIWGYAAAVVPIAYYLNARAAVFAHRNPGEFPLVDNPLVAADFWSARLTAMKVIGKYLWLYAWPVRLSSDYSYNQIRVAVDWQALLSLAICGAAAAAALVFFVRRKTRPGRAIFFFVFFFFVTLAPTSNVFLLIGTIMAERFLYLPSIGLAACVVMAVFWAARRMAPRRSTVVASSIIAALSLGLAARTLARNFDWFDDRSLSLASVKAAPDSFKTHLNVGHDELETKRPNLDLAIRELERSVAILSDLPDGESTPRTYAAAGEAYRRKGDATPDGPAREQWYRKALAVLLKGERIDLAGKAHVQEVNLRRGLTVMSVGWDPLYLELGRVYLRLGDPDKAVEELQYGCFIKPLAEFFEEMSRAYRLKGDNRQAEITLMEGLVTDPSITLFASELVDLYSKAEPLSCAVKQGQTGASLELGCPLVHEQLCAAARNVTLRHAKAGRRDEAVATARSAVQEMGCPAEMFR
jgi:tetratricopeptide (TPR) repeat protein